MSLKEAAKACLSLHCQNATLLEITCRVSFIHALESSVNNGDGATLVKVSKDAKIRNRYNQVPHLTQDTNGKVTNSQLDTTSESQEALSQQVTTKHI